MYDLNGYSMGMASSVPDVSASTVLVSQTFPCFMRIIWRTGQRSLSMLTFHAMETCQPRDRTWMMRAETVAAGRQVVHTCVRSRTSVSCLARGRCRSVCRSQLL
jgi:hypothetical protein